MFESNRVFVVKFKDKNVVQFIRYLAILFEGDINDRITVPFKHPMKDWHNIINLHNVVILGFTLIHMGEDN